MDLREEERMGVVEGEQMGQVGEEIVLEHRLDGVRLK